MTRSSDTTVGKYRRFKGVDNVGVRRFTSVKRVKDTFRETGDFESRDSKEDNDDKQSRYFSSPTRDTEDGR